MPPFNVHTALAFARRERLSTVRLFGYILKFDTCIFRIQSRSIIKANSHIPCHFQAVPLPCCAAKGLDCVFYIWFAQCDRVWFTHAMPFPCHTTTMPFWKRPLKATAQCGMGTAWYVWISIGRPETASGRPARVQLLPATKRGSTKVVYQRLTNGSDTRISVYHADFHEWHGTVGEGSRHGMCELTRQGNGMGTAWYVWISLYWS
jgi:hypothetical protein